MGRGHQGERVGFFLEVILGVAIQRSQLGMKACGCVTSRLRRRRLTRSFKGRGIKSHQGAETSWSPAGKLGAVTVSLEPKVMFSVTRAHSHQPWSSRRQIRSPCV
ncbi:hypothetical protein GOODEAATRI_003304 [Goodea atripinnis]|uniref:Uncharacterized protein n=1 Tax=Goodea atripinnis TaxID=208336 RepID=A0ABV0PB26_9TELE